MMTVPRSRWTATLALLLAGLLLVPARLSAAQPAEPEKIQEVADAIEKFQEKDFTAAFELLKDARKSHPDLPPAQLMMAQLFARANLPVGVRNWLEKAVVDLPDDPEAYLVLADFNLREGRYTEADLLLTKAAALMKDFKASKKRKDAIQPQIFAGQAAVAEYREDWRGAQKLLEAWLALDKVNAQVMQRLGRVLFLQNDTASMKAAYEMFKNAKAADDKVLLPEAQMAQLYEAQAQQESAKKRDDAAKKLHESAEKWMESALKLAPKDDVETRLVAAQWAVGTDQIDKANEWASAALKINQDNLNALIMCGIVALFKEDYKTAELYCEMAHLKSPANFAAVNNLALALVDQDKDKNSAAKKRKALEYAADSVKRNERNPEAWSTLGWVLYKNGNLDDAEKALSKAMSGGQVSADTAYYFARVLAEKGNRPQAEKFAQAAVDSKQPFTKRREANLLLAELKSKAPAEKPSKKPADKTSDKTGDKTSDKTSGK